MEEEQEEEDVAQGCSNSKSLIIIITGTAIYKII